METRKCKRCCEVKENGQFRFNKTLGTIGNICKRCRRKRDAEQRTANREQFRADHRKWRAANPEHVRAYSRQQSEKLRDAIIAAYGPDCACCGEAHREFLTLDHINGGGTAHRKSLHGKVYGQLRTQGFPAGYRILCWNCNWAFRLAGNCPHQSAG